MALWTGSVGVITHRSLEVVERDEGYYETAATTAVASLLLTGSPRVYNETAAINSISTVSATEVGSSIGVITNPVLIADGTGLVGTFSQGAITLPLPTVLAGEFKAGDITNPLPTVSGTLPAAAFGIANITSPSPIASGQVISGQYIIGSVQVPVSQVSGTTGSIAAVQPSIPVVSATGLTGRIGIGTVRNPLAQISGILSQRDFWTGDVLIPSFIVSGEMAQGTVNIGSAQNRLASISATGLNGTVGIGAVTPGLVEVITVFSSEVFLTGDISLPLPLVRGNAPLTISDFITWVLNTKSNRTTNYTDFPFIALGHMGTAPMGVTADGIYLLTGDNDEGVAISSIFKFGMTDFRSELSNASHIYVGGDIEGDMEISILEDGQDIDNVYAISEREQHVRGHHAKLGKGFRSRYRQLSISNVNGGNFELDSLSLSSRDLRGNE